jgi:CRP-like cAMP-binding protein
MPEAARPSSPLDRLPICAELPPRARRRLADAALMRHYEAGAVIGNAGCGGAVMLVLEGEVREGHTDSESGVVTSRLAGAGSLLGLGALFGGTALGGPAVVQAVTPAQLAIFDSAAFLDLMRIHGGLAVAVLRQVMDAGGGRGANRPAPMPAAGGAHAADTGETSDAGRRRRIAAALVRMATAAPEGGARIENMPRHRALARQLALREADVAAALGLMMREGLACRQGTSLYLPDVTALRARLGLEG